jgi:hypothetical protein
MPMQNGNAHTAGLGLRTLASSGSRSVRAPHIRASAAGIHQTSAARRTVAYQANNNNTGATSSGGLHAAGLALLGQYAASSFVMPAGTSGGTAIHDALSSSFAPTLVKSSQG